MARHVVAGRCRNLITDEPRGAIRARADCVIGALQGVDEPESLVAASLLSARILQVCIRRIQDVAHSDVQQIHA